MYFHLTKEEIESKFKGIKIQEYRISNIQKDLTSQMEKFVDKYLIKHNGTPPTYKEIGKHFGLGISATYVRLKRYRHKLKTHESRFGRIKLSEDKPDCEECKFQVDYMDEDKWPEKCGHCGESMADKRGFISWDEYKKSLKL